MNIIPRAEWGATPPKEPYASMTPTERPTLHWNGPRTGLTATSTIDEEAEMLRGVQRFHKVDRQWNDIAYSFLVAPSGRVFEGRGWGHRTAANGTARGNDESLAFFLMSGRGETPTDEMIAAVRELAADDRAGPGLGVVPHSKWKPTECPGDVVRSLIVDGAFVNDTRDRDVTNFQRALNVAHRTLFYDPLAEDGVFGPKTAAAARVHIQRSDLLYSIEETLGVR